MLLEKKEILTYRRGKGVQDQFMIDEDYNVPDVKPDVQRIILSDGKIVTEAMKKVENYIRVTGRIEFKVLYVTDEGILRLASADGKIPFEEMIYMEDIPEGNLFMQKAEMDLTATVIHSRKLNLKAVVNMEVISEGQETLEITTNVESENRVMKKRGNQEILKLVGVKNDTYRIKEEAELDGTKENISSFLWNKIENRKLDIRIGTDELSLQGELLFFCFYETGDGKVEWLEKVVPYQGKIQMYGAKENMYHQIYPELKDMNIDMRMDEDGEMRRIGIEATLEVKVILYEEESVEILEDLYSLEQKCIPEKKEKEMEQLLMQNHSKCKVTERLSLPEIKDDILQICHSSAKIQLENTEILESGIQAEGVLYISFLYVKPDDTIPFDVWHGMIPFSCVIESNAVSEDMEVCLTASVEQMAIGLMGSDEIEVKAVLAFQSILKKALKIENIEKILCEPVDQKKLGKMPGIVGYIVKEGDILWDLAKQYNTTEENIMEINALDVKELKEGQKILIFKENMSIL